MPEAVAPAAVAPLRAPQPDEAAALVRFIAVLNQPGPQHCLHLGESEAAIEADLERDGIDVCASFVLAQGSAGWRGAIGLDREGEKAWLLGPWAFDESDRSTRLALLNAALAAPGLAQVNAFSNVRCQALNAELESVGFVRHSEVHVMQARRAAWHDPGEAAFAVTEAGDGDAPVVAGLHDAVFPHTWLAGDALLAHARKRGALLVMRDAGQGVLGSLCLTFNAALPEADVEFIAVQAQARGRGVGRALLRAALRRSFGDAQREIVNLCVNDANLGALRLYESAGFERLFTGAAMRWLRSAGEPAA